MSDDLFRVLHFLAYLPVYVATFVGIGLVLQLRKTHPAACWSAVGAGVVLSLNWGVIWLSFWSSREIAQWFNARAIDLHYAWLGFDIIQSGLQTIAVVLLVAALLVGRRKEP